MGDGAVEVSGLRLHYKEWLPADSGPPATFVLVHGLGSSCHIWDLVAAKLAEHYRVLALDQRGHGESEQPDDGYDFASIVGDLSSFLTATGAEPPLVLVGHSWGASVVLHFAVEHPDGCAGVILVDGGTGSPGERMTWDETLARLTPPEIDGLRWEDLRQRMTRNNGVYEDPRVEAVGRSLFHFDAEGRISRRLKIPNHLRVLRALWEQRPAELLPRLNCPVRLLPARQASDAAEWRASKIATIQRALELQPRASVRWFEDTIHDIPLQRPDELAQEMLDFAAYVLAESAQHSAMT
ncbi:MAG TPA: alpha/beta hydrolase [Chloroflexota bacterium]|nr:alpha/beta hydrolase [Chloroflexota bacterium]